MASRKEVERLEEERDTLQLAIDEIAQWKRDPAEHPMIVSQLQELRVHLPRVSKVVPPGKYATRLVSMHAHLSAIEAQLVETPAEVLSSARDVAALRLADVVARLKAVKDNGGSIGRESG